MADNTLVVQIDLEKGDVKSAFGGISKDAKKAGKKSGKNFGEGFGDGVKSAAGIAAKAAAALGVVAIGVGVVAVKAAQKQEDAINSLNIALQATGKFSEETSQDLQDFASSLQQVTRFGDEAILESQALLQTLGNLSKDGLKEATQAALDLASGLKIDLRAATVLVGKAASGEVSSFSRYGLSIETAATKAGTFANALDAIQGRFGGAAQKDVLSFSGTIDQLSNNFGDILEEIGFFIIKNKFVLKGLELLNGAFKKAVESTKEFITGIDTFEDIIQPLVAFNDAIITFVVSPLELLKNIFVVVKAGMETFVAAIVGGFGQIAGTAGDIIALFAPGSAMAVGLQDFADTSRDVFRESAAEAGRALSGILDFPITEKFATLNENFSTGMQALNETVTTQSSDIAEKNKLAVEGVAVTTANSLLGVWQGLSVGIKTSAEQIKVQGAKTAAIVKGGLVKGIAGGIQTLTTALMKGEDAFAAFGSFILSTIGDLAIQLGTFFIAEGIAIEALNAVSGTGAIAAGAGLVALGSILKAFTGSGGASAASSSSGGSAPTPSFAEDTAALAATAAPEDEDFASERTGVTLNVEGSIFNTEETARSLTDLLNENFESSGAVLTGARFA